MIDFTPLQAVIMAIESGGNEFAMRFEPSVFAKVTRNNSGVQILKQRNHCTTDTARVIYSTSWGLFQIMGFNLASSDSMDEPVGLFMENEDLQRDEFERFCLTRKLPTDLGKVLESEQSILNFARKYNGSENYAILIKQTALRMGYM